MNNNCVRSQVKLTHSDKEYAFGTTLFMIICSFAGPAWMSHCHCHSLSHCHVFPLLLQLIAVPAVCSNSTIFPSLWRPWCAATTPVFPTQVRETVSNPVYWRHFSHFSRYVNEICVNNKNLPYLLFLSRNSRWYSLCCVTMPPCPPGRHIGIDG